MNIPEPCFTTTRRVSCVSEIESNENCDLLHLNYHIFPSFFIRHVMCFMRCYCSEWGGFTISFSLILIVTSKSVMFILRSRFFCLSLLIIFFHFGCSHRVRCEFTPRWNLVFSILSWFMNVERKKGSKLNREKTHIECHSGGQKSQPNSTS